MRDIEFRGKRIDNGEWVEGYYYKAKYCRTDDELCDYITIPHPKEYNEPSSHYIVNPETIGQYTGLKDKNGKNIFEGDTVWFGDEKERGVVYFDNSCSRFAVRFDTFDAAFDHLYSNELEIIGNVHDNPELTEGGE